MTINDFPELLALWNKTNLNIFNIEKEKKEFKILIQWNPDSCYKIINNGKIIGSAIGAFNGRRAWIYHFAIDPIYQKKGLGSLLYKTIEKKLKEKKVTKILLGVSLKNLEVMQFYKKHGFNVMNDAVIMEKDLWKEVKKI